MLASTIQFSNHHAPHDPTSHPGPATTHGHRTAPQKTCGVAVREPKSIPLPLPDGTNPIQADDLFHTSIHTIRHDCHAIVWHTLSKKHWTARAFAIAAEPPEKTNPLKHIEDTVEQNDNNFDGIINNTPQTPTVGELEQKVKAGEPISLVDLANAMKAEKAQGKEKSKTPARREEKPSIREQLKKAKETAAPKKAAKQKNHDLEV